jgi:ABC-type nitrate/sulfonate/bicarbonate transport system permease component
MFGIRKKLTPQMDIALSVGGMLFVLLVWCIVTYGGYVKPIFLPTPTGIFEGFGELHQKGWLFPAILRSTWRVTQALLLVIAIGVPVGLLMGAFPAVDALLRPLINGGKSVPTTGIVGLIVLWFSIEEKAKIVFLFLGAIFYMVILVKNAVQSVPEEYVRVATDVGASPFQLAQRVLIPGALPQIWDAIAVCNGIMWTYIVLAEFINSSEESLGLGFLLSTSSRTNEPGQVFAVLIVIAVISSVTDWALQWVRRRYLNW